jgi:hypothetical protein
MFIAFSKVHRFLPHQYSTDERYELHERCRGCIQSVPIVRQSNLPDFQAKEDDFQDEVSLPFFIVYRVLLCWTMMEKYDICIFAETNFRNQCKRFGIRRRDRRHHIYVLGKTGMGKSTLLEHLIYADLYADAGLAVLDPHGDLVKRIRRYIPEWYIR